MFETLKALMGGATRESIRECRHCGTAVDGGVECPSCGSSDIARYEIE